jgi:hypothetical protein
MQGLDERRGHYWYLGRVLDILTSGVIKGENPSLLEEIFRVL